MDRHSQLKALFREHLAWHGARLSFLSSAVLALLVTRSVVLGELANVFPGRAKTASHYKRLQRFFRDFTVDFDAVARLLASMVVEPEEKFVLTVDRTCWKLGGTSINILVLGIAWHATAIPLFWSFIDSKGGNSCTQARIDIMERFLAVFGTERIDCLVADREFIGKAWFKYLRRRDIHFRIRIKADTQVANARGHLVRATHLFRSLPIGHYQALSRPRRMWDQDLYIIGLRLEDGQYLLLATPEAPDSALDDYAKRWGIETLFGSLKTRGFAFESTHITDPERIRKLVVVLAIAFTWACRVGEWLHEHVKALRVKKHGRLEKSLFRYGLDHLQHCLLKVVANLVATPDYRGLVQLLSCT